MKTNEEIINNLKEKIFDILEDEFNPLDGSAKAELIAEDNKELSEKMINEVRSTITDIQREIYEENVHLESKLSSILGQLQNIPVSNYIGGFNRYNTDDEIVLHVWSVNGKSYDIRTSNSLQSPAKEEGEE